MKSLNLILALFFIAIVTPVVRADGALGFLTTDSTFKSGDAFSWLEKGTDWDKVTMSPPIMGVVHALPNQTQNITVTTKRDGSNLIMVFTFNDNTQTLSGGNLLIGDKVIVQIDPNNSRSATLETGTNSPGDNTQDYRFEIKINSNAPVSAQFRTPSAPDDWHPAQNLSSGASANFMSKVLPEGPGYEITLTIPFTFLGFNGLPTHDIGITFGIINDLGNTTSAGTSDVTGTEFPQSMGLDETVNSIGLIAGELASGSWIKPARWGVGFFSLTSQQVTLTHSPSKYWSDSIRISTCNTDHWCETGGPTPCVPDSGIGTNQLNLPNWYHFNTNQPCKMKVWFNAYKMNPGSVAKRFLILWSNAGTGPENWFLVTLTNPIVLSLPENKNFFVWTTVPAVNFTSHPCLRVYVLPENLGNIDGVTGEVFIRGNGIPGDPHEKPLSTSAQLAQVETAFMIQPGLGDQQSAQMNFTASEPGTSCPSGSPCACLTPATKQFVADNRDLRQDSNVRMVPVNFTNDVSAWGGAEPAEPEAGNNGVQVSDRGGPVRITAEAVGVAVRSGTGKPYTYLERLGGVAWTFENDVLVKRKILNLEFEITNPRLLQRDFTANPPADIPAPKRTIFVLIKVAASSGIPNPIIVSAPPAVTLNPGETVKGTITIAPGSGSTTPGPPNFKRWGLSLHGGVSIPHGNLNSVFDPGPNVGVDLEYRINSMFSLEGIYTFHRFNGETFGAFTIPDLNVHQVSVNGKVYGSSSPWRPFFNFGGGVYNFNTSTTRGGLNVGGGLQFDVTPNVAVDAMYNFHNVFTSGSNTRFSTVQGGVRFRF